MDEYKVKGDIFLGVLKLVASKWGTHGLECIGANPESIALEQWYPYEDFCTLLSDIKSKLATGNPMIIYQIGFSMVKMDRRWQEVFHSQNPADVFTTNKRQESQYLVGSYSASVLGPKHVQVAMTGGNCRPEWCEFYRGRLQGVLELTGRTGVVHLRQPKAEGSERVFDIKWG